MPTVPSGTNTSGYGQSPVAAPSQTNLLMAAATMADQARSMPGSRSKEPDLKPGRRKHTKVLK